MFRACTPKHPRRVAHGLRCYFPYHYMPNARLQYCEQATHKFNRYIRSQSFFLLQFRSECRHSFIVCRAVRPTTLFNCSKHVPGGLPARMQTMTSFAITIDQNPKHFSMFNADREGGTYHTFVSYQPYVHESSFGPERSLFSTAVYGR